MATIILDIGATIPGEATRTGFAGKLEALSIRDSIEIDSAYTTAGTTTTRTAGEAKQSDIELIRKRDKGSPLLAQACANGTDLGEVKIYLLKTVGTGLSTFMQFTLKDTYVSRYESETADDKGSAYKPHLGSLSSKLPKLSAALVGVNTILPPKDERGRPSPRSLLPDLPGTARDTEIERVWLNASGVIWTYTPYTGTTAGGAIVKGWSTLNAAEITA